MKQTRLPQVITSFQWLEKSSEKFPMIGKMARNISNGWKNRPKSFQWLELSEIAIRPPQRCTHPLASFQRIIT
ncbi:MAG: hypothetical protein EOM12_03965 [Verrucomicrobiae bacterium]|nr:hypothetical protein [Verrucomicrobiae bacterium]